MSKSHKSTAWLNGQLAFTITTSKREDGLTEATANGAQGIKGVGAEDHLAVLDFKSKVRDAAMKGEL